MCVNRETTMNLAHVFYGEVKKTFSILRLYTVLSHHHVTVFPFMWIEFQIPVEHLTTFDL